MRSNEHRPVFCKESGAVNVVFTGGRKMIVDGKTNEVRGTSKITAFKDSSEGAITQKRLLSKRELAGVLNVSERTIDNWLAGKRIPRLRLSARLTRFSLPKVEAALARYEVREIG
ncbi:MAG: helix-turn-helix transcriptional regulator, partial [Chthoniobacterales bacterium]